MSDQIRKWKDEAAKQLQKGRYSKALELFRKVVEGDPSDLACHNNIGYILRKLGRKAEAVEVFGRLGAEYAQRGFLLKAIATCKVVLEIDPSQTAIQQQLADLYSKREGAEPASVKINQEPSPAPTLAPLELTPITAAGPAGNTAPPLVSGAATPLAHLDLEAPAMIDSPDMVEFGMIELTPMPMKAPEEAPKQEPIQEPMQPVPEVIEPQEEIEEAEIVEEAEDSLDVADESVDESVDTDFILDLDVEEPVQQEMTLPQIPLLSDLESKAFISLLERMRMIRTKPGDWILKEGEPGDTMYLVASGSVRVLKQLDAKQALQLAVLGEGAFFGEMSVLRGGPRGASVQAVKAGEIFEISRSLLEELITQHPSMGVVLNRFATQRLLRNVMTTSGLFKSFGKEERVRIIERFVSRDMAPGDLLIDEGHEASGFFIVLRGRVEVFRCTEDGTPFVLGELAEGEVFGEISCLHKEPAVASVRGKTRGAILRLPRKDFDELVMSHPQILELVSNLGETRKALTFNTLAQKGILI